MDYLVQFQAQAQKNKKNPPKRISYISESGTFQLLD